MVSEAASAGAARKEVPHVVDLCVMTGTPSGWTDTPERLDQSLAAASAAIVGGAFTRRASDAQSWATTVTELVGAGAGPGTITSLAVVEPVPGTLAWHTRHYALAGDPAPSAALARALRSEAEAGFPSDDFATHAGHRGERPRRTAGARRAHLADDRWAQTSYASFRRPLGLHEFVRVVLPFEDVEATHALILQIDLTRADAQPSERHVTLASAVAPGLLGAYHGRFVALRAHRASILGRLTRAQANVLPHLVEGLSESEVAREIGRSAHTVHDHTKTIYQALGVNSRLQLRDLWFGRPRARGNGAMNTGAG